MRTIYGVYKNSDMTEGRGPMVLVAAFSDENEAWKYTDQFDGVFGRTPSSGHWRNSDMGDWDVEPIQVYDRAEELIHINEEDQRKKALAKLTQRERELLGL